jgi:methylated-DNA-[protein]-cysteine S-methyltransferase
MSDTSLPHESDAFQWTVYDSPLGPLTLIYGPAGMTGLHFGPALGLAESAQRSAAFGDVTGQLEEYFAGERDRFDLEVDLDRAGTPFQRRVWRQLLRIPYGTTVSYTALAQIVGRPDRLRAVAAAVARTPVAIVVPCHRVIGADGSLTGYSGGLARKRALLDLERRARAGLAPEPPWAFRQLALV